MINLLVGLKGAGKTKVLVDEVNKAALESKGSVVCIEYARKLTFNIKPSVRLIDADHYGINNASTLYGFVCGILAGNYDVVDLYIDSALKICGNDIKEFEVFINNIKPIIIKNNIKCIITASVAIENLPDSLLPLVQEL